MEGCSTTGPTWDVHESGHSPKVKVVTGRCDRGPSPPKRLDTQMAREAQCRSTHRKRMTIFLHYDLLLVLDYREDSYNENRGLFKLHIRRNGCHTPGIAIHRDGVLVHFKSLRSWPPWLAAIAAIESSVSGTTDKLRLLERVVAF